MLDAKIPWNDCSMGFFMIDFYVAQIAHLSLFNAFFCLEFDSNLIKDGRKAKN